jgi:hypothetical protein
MNIAIALLLLLGLLVMLGSAVISVIENLTQSSPFDDPLFREPGPIFHDHNLGQESPRSQFAWRSRSHSRAPD